MNKGFTLIEVLIYIALFSLLMGTAFATAFNLIDGSSKLSAQTTTAEEGNFVLRKINWALTGASSFTNTANTIHINKYDGDKIDIVLDGTKIKMTESAGGSGFITTDNVSVDSLQFTPTGTKPAGITAVAIIGGKEFSITKYLRQ